MARGPWLSADEIAKRLSVPKNFVYVGIAEKAMPAHKVGRIWRFQISEVDDWVGSEGAATADSS